MKQEDLRAARLIEAKRRWIEDETPRREVEHLADLYETNWTPVDPVWWRRPGGWLSTSSLRSAPPRREREITTPGGISEPTSQASSTKGGE